MERGQRTETLREPVYRGQKVHTHFSLLSHFHSVMFSSAYICILFFSLIFSPENRAKVTGEAAAGVTDLVSCNFSSLGGVRKRWKLSV